MITFPGKRSQALSNLQKFRELVRRASNGEPLGDLGPYLAMAGHDFLNKKFKTLEDCFGLSNGQGQSSVFTQEGIDDRNAAIVALAKKFYPDKSIYEQAHAIDVEFKRYQTGRWRFDQEKESMPAEYRNTIKAYLYLALTSYPKIPAAKQLIRILSNGH